MNDEISVNGVRVPLDFPRVPAGWDWKSLNVLCEGIYDCPHSTPDLTDDGPYLARTQDFPDGALSLNGMAQVSRATYLDRVRRAIPAYGDLLYSREGSYHGIAAEIPEDVEICMGQRMVLIRPDQDLLNFRFLKYWLNSRFVRDFISGMREGSGAPRINLPTVRGMAVPVPAVREQEAISSILGALDDKIAVNERIAATADALASALFEASEAKKHYRLSDVASIVMGQSPPGETYNETGDGIPFYQGVRDFGMRHPGHRVWCTEASRHAGAGDVLVSVRAPVGTINVAEETCGIGRGVAAVRAIQYPHVLLQALSSDGSVWRPYEAEGTVFGSINKKQLSLLEVSWPNESQIEAVEGQLSVLDRQVSQVLHESRSLSILRDTLLPQLMSGRLRIKDAEKIVEDHV
ncbi:restriction endonuclease subunit S [Streptomyces sp. NPDC001493]